MPITTLLFSKKADKQHGHMVVTTPMGEVKYTVMGDEEKYGPWRSWYGWDDAVEVYVGDIEGMKTNRISREIIFPGKEFSNTSHKTEHNR